MLAITLTGCSGDTDNPDINPNVPSNTQGTDGPKPTLPDGTSEGTPKPLPEDAPIIDGTSVDPDTGEIDYCAGQDPSTSVGPAAEKFGKQEVLDAYCEAIEVFDLFAATDLVYQSEDTLKEGQFYGVRPYLTPDARNDWDTTVSQVGKEDVEATIGAFYYYDFENETYQVDPDVYPIAARAVSPARTDVVKQDDGEEVLWLNADYRVDFNVINKKTGKLQVLPMVKNLSLYMVPSGEDEIPWLIKGWRAEFDVYDAKPRPKTNG